MNRRLRSFMKAVVVCSIVALLPSAMLAQADAKVDLSGKWLFNVTTDAGTGTPTVTFKQQGDSLTGHYSSQALGEAELKGTVKERKINFSFRVELQGTALTVTYAGVVEGNDAMKGTIDIGGAATGTFSAKRQ